MKLTVSKKAELEKLIHNWLKQRNIETGGLVIDVYFPEPLKVNLHDTRKPLKKGKLLDSVLTIQDWKVILDLPFKPGDRSILLKLKKENNMPLTDEDFGRSNGFGERRLFVQRVNILFRQSRVVYRMNTNPPYKIKVMVCRN